MSAEPSEMQQFEALLNERDHALWGTEHTSREPRGEIIGRTEAALRAFVASLAKDKARVDIIERVGETAYPASWDDNGFWYTKIKGEYVSASTLRLLCDAIDAAMTGGEKS